MIGFIVKYLGRNFKVGSSESDATLNVTLVRNEFILEGSSGQPYIVRFNCRKTGLNLMSKWLNLMRLLSRLQLIIIKILVRSILCISK